jgi:hypothetical protein
MFHRVVQSVGVVAVLATLGAVGPGAQTPSVRAVNPASPEGVLAAYLAGDAEAIPRRFKTSLDFQNALKLAEPRELDRWLGAFDPGKAVFVLSLAQTAADVAPQYTAVLLRTGAKYVDEPRSRSGSAAPSDFARDWHRAAVGLLQGLHHGPAIEEHVTAIGLSARRDVMADGRLILARGIAQELRCWAERPSLDQPSMRVAELAKAAGAVVKNDLDGPNRERREALFTDQRACLDEGVARFDQARAQADARAEAGVRGGWLLIQQAKFSDALAWLDAAAPGPDRTLGYWRSLFRGRALSGLNRHGEAADAYKDAFVRFPGAQSAGLGLAFELMLLDRDDEADQIARALRATAASAVDPWTSYLEADQRFSRDLIEQLRKRVTE